MEGGGIVLCILHLSPVFYYVFLFVGKNYGEFCYMLIGWFIKMSIQTFQPLNVIYRRGNFVYQHWVCPSIYRSSFFPFRSLHSLKPNKFVWKPAIVFWTHTISHGGINLWKPFYFYTKIKTANLLFFIFSVYYCRCSTTRAYPVFTLY